MYHLTNNKNVFIYLFNNNSYAVTQNSKVINYQTKYKLINR